MKKLTFLVCLLLTSCFCSSALGQNQPTLVYTTVETKPEKHKRYWKFYSEFTATNKVETDNKVGILESPIGAYKSTFVNSDGKKEFTLESTTGFPMHNAFDNHYFDFRIVAKRKYANNFSLGADSEFAFTRFKSYGRIGVKTAKLFGNETKSIQPFSKVDFYFPLGNQFSYEEFGNQFGHNRGVSWSNGFLANLEFQKFIIENKNQLILDSGAVLPGKRTLFNSEVSFGYKMNRFCFGPMFGYTRLVSGTFPQRNSVVAGMFVRYQ